MKKIKLISSIILLILVIGAGSAYSQDNDGDGKVDVKSSLFSIRAGGDLGIIAVGSYYSGDPDAMLFILPYFNIDFALSYYFSVIGIDINLKYDFLDGSASFLNFDIGILINFPFENWILRNCAKITSCSL